MSLTFDKSHVSRSQTKLPPAFKIIASDFNQGKEIPAKDLFALAIEIKAACPEFSEFDIAVTFNIPAEEAPAIASGAAIRAVELLKEKEQKKAQAKAARKEVKLNEIIQLKTNGKCPDWVNINGEGQPVLSPANVAKMLEFLNITLRLNQFSNTFEITGLESVGHTAVTDMSLDWIFFRSQEKDISLYVPSRALLDAALNQVGYTNRYHPVKNYIESIEWDGVSRLDTWLIDTAGVVDDAYSRAVSSLTLMAAVKRVYDPGCEFHEMLILQSAQGWGKSGAMKALCPNPEWFSDDLPLGADAKLVIERTAGKWIIEAAEMQNFNKTGHNQMKAFMSRASDKAREAFARKTVEIRRQFIIIGTVNETEFLSDPTGDRRYWPLSITKEMDKEAIEAIRDQLWAEAYQRAVIEKQSIRMDRSIWALAELHRQAFTVNNQFKEGLMPVLYGHTGRITNAALYQICGIPMENRKGHAKMRKAMEELGWTQTNPIWKDGNTVRCWEKGGSKRWLEPERDPKTGRWVFRVNKTMSNAEMDQLTQGHFEDIPDFDDFEESDPTEKPN